MSIAILVESEVGNGKEQTLLVPTTHNVLTFHRFSTGQRGRGQAWQVIINDDSLPTTPVSYDPIAVVLSNRDMDNASVGNVTALSIKAMSFPKGNPIQPIAHNEFVTSLRDRLIAGDMQLNNYVRDGRRTNPVMLRPIVSGAVSESNTRSIETPAALITPVVPQTKQDNVIQMPTRPHIEIVKVPDSKWADEYINRKINGRTEFDIYDVAMREHENVIIEGHAGSGKTMSVLAYAASRGYKYYNVSSNVGLEPSHLFGQWVPTEFGTFRWQDGPVTTLVREGGVLLLNEIDFMPERVTTVLFGLLDSRREIQLLENGGEVIKAHPELLVVGDHNPNYRGSRPMNQAWLDRFHHKLEFPYDKAIERKLIGNAALLEVADKLRAMSDKGEIDTPISTRSLVSFVKNVKHLSLDYAITSYTNGFRTDEREAVKLVMETAKSNIGEGFGISVATSAIQGDE